MTKSLFPIHSGYAKRSENQNVCTLETCADKTCIFTSYSTLRLSFLLAAFVLIGLLQLHLTATAQAVTVSTTLRAFIPPLSPARIGDTVNIPIVLAATQPSARQRVIPSVEFVFRFNPNVVYLLDTSLSRLAGYSDNGMYVTIRRTLGRRLRANEDTILQIPILVTWGDAQYSELKIGRETGPGADYTFQIFNSNGIAEEIVPVINGLLRIQDMDWGNTSFAITQSRSPLRMTLAPNPVVDRILNFQLSIGTLSLPDSPQPTLVLYFITGENAGENALDLTPLLMPLFRNNRTTETLRITEANLMPFRQKFPSRGLYLCRFTYSTYSVSRLVFIQ